MKNELGIEVKCENCLYYFMNDIGKVWCDKEFETRCKKKNLMLFQPRNAKLEKRVKELQEQQFTEKELHIIKNMIIILLSHNQQLYELHLTPLLKKLERIINEQ